MKQNKDEESWLFSDSFLKRSFAIWGYNLVANIIVYVLVMVVATIVSFSLGG